MGEKLDCITCGSDKVDHRMTRYFVIPGMVIVPNAYLLCQEHKNLNYYFDDIYDKDSKRKKIDHQAVIERSLDKKIVVERSIFEAEE